MKIAILTLPLHTNYGGILQAYALQTVLQRMGHDVVLIDKPKKTHCLPFVICKRFFLKYVCRKNVAIPLKNQRRKDRMLYCSEIISFFERYLSILRVSDLDQVSKIKFDAYIVGSDQIWRPVYFKDLSHNMADAFLLFVSHQKIRKIAYAASFGMDQWEYSAIETKKCSELIQMFDAVSVREKSGVSLCTNYLGYKKAEWVLDPTMLLVKEDYLALIDNANIPSSKGNLFVCILDRTDEKENIINGVVQELKFTPFECLSHLTKKQHIAEPVEKWLRAFSDAEMIVTDSFHACVFAILFRKPFLAIANKDRGLARFTSLLDLFGLLDRLVYSYSDFENKKSQLLSVNYHCIDDILAKERVKSLIFLKKGLNK